MTKALLIVDVQSYFIKSAPQDFATRIVEHIKKTNYNYLVFTAFRNSPNSIFRKNLKWTECQEDKDTELPSEFKSFISDNIFESRDTYSALKSKKIRNYLDKNHVNELDICGIDTDACVLATAFEAFDLGFKVSVLYDLCFSSANLDEAAKKIITRNLNTRN